VSATLADRAYEELLDQIVTLRRTPGTLLNEAELVRELGTSRTPVREAILRLARLGLVVAIPRRGTFVSEVHVGQVAKVYELRRELEGLAAAWAAERADADGRDAARAMAGLLRGIDVRPDADARSQHALDRRAHFLVYELAGNPFARELLESHYLISARMWSLAGGHVAMEEPFALMIDLLEAVAAGDPPRAAALAHRHNDHAVQTLRAAL
jgi:DNA-binding GntR family transcriptional regulator